MVWVADEGSGRLAERRVEMERLGRRAPRCAATLKDGDKVVVLGVHRLDASMPIRISELH